MTKVVIVIWLVLTGGVATTLTGLTGPNKPTDEMLRHVEAAQAAEEAADWQQAADCYQRAIASCPPDQIDELLRLRLRRAIASIRGDDLPATRRQLQSLLEEAQSLGAAEEVVRDIRHTFAKASYDLALQLRHEGAGQDLWQEYGRAARQQYQLLTEDALARGDDLTVVFQTNLERAVRLLRADQSVLAGMAFPSNCWSTTDCENRIRNERQRQKRKPKGGGDDRTPIEGAHLREAEGW